MRFPRRLAWLAALVPCSALAMAAITVQVGSIDGYGRIADSAALCAPAADGKSIGGQNIRPTIGWSAGPVGTRSYAILVTDPDVPADLSQADKAAAPIEENAPRQLYYHWALFNIPPGTTALAAGPGAPAVGIAATNDVSPDKLAYGGPCPPWNDERLHHYHFTVYALDANLPLAQGAIARDVAAALAPHVLAKGEAVGTYSTNPLLLHK